MKKEWQKKKKSHGSRLGHVWRELLLSLPVASLPLFCANRHLLADRWAPWEQGVQRDCQGCQGERYHQQDSSLTARPLPAQQMASVCWWCFSKAIELLDTVGACPLCRITSISQVWGGFEDAVCWRFSPASLLATPEADLRAEPWSHDLEDEGCLLM